MATNNTTLRSILEKDKLNSKNFLDGYRNLRIVLKHKRKLYVIDKAILDEPAPDTPKIERNAFNKYKEDSLDVTCIMLATMEPELQKQMEDMEAYDVIVHLKEMFQVQARHERFAVTKEINSCKMALGSSVSAHVLKMKSYIDRLEKLGSLVTREMATDLILGSLPPSYDQFVMTTTCTKWMCLSCSCMGCLRM